MLYLHHHSNKFLAERNLILITLSLTFISQQSTEIMIEVYTRSSTCLVWNLVQVILEKGQAEDASDSDLLEADKVDVAVEVEHDDELDLVEEVDSEVVTAMWLCSSQLAGLESVEVVDSEANLKVRIYLNQRFYRKEEA